MYLDTLALLADEIDPVVLRNATKDEIIQIIQNLEQQGKINLSYEAITVGGQTKINAQAQELKHIVYNLLSQNGGLTTADAEIIADRLYRLRNYQSGSLPEEYTSSSSSCSSSSYSSSSYSSSSYSSSSCSNSSSSYSSSSCCSSSYSSSSSSNSLSSSSELESSLVTQLFKITAPDFSANAYFGRAVCVKGDDIIIGAPDIEAAYIFHRTDGVWDAGTKIVAADSEVDDDFGNSVSIDGDYAVVGASFEDQVGTSAGAIYVFNRVAGVWDAGVKIIAPDAQADDYFGCAVSIDGDYIAVGAYSEDTGGSQSGAAYIFHRTGVNTWDAGTKIVAADPEVNDTFGVVIAIDGDYVVVGAVGEDQNGSNAGAAYVFHRTDVNTWDAGVKLLANAGQAGDTFGKSVAISGDYIIVGAVDESTIASCAGAAYIFHRTDVNAWDASYKIVPTESFTDDWFGYRVSISGDYAVVGTWGYDYDDHIAGAAYLYHRTDVNVWDTGFQIIPADMLSEDNYGAYVSVSGTDIVVTSYANDEFANNGGAAYIYRINS